MKVCIISDTHSKHTSVTIPECDILLHAGDFTINGWGIEIESFARWFDSQPAIERIAIPGNHDWYCQNSPEESKRIFSDLGSRLLIDETTEVLGLKIYGSPWSPWFHNWAFNFPKADKHVHILAKDHWSRIPDDTDIILTHGPPHGILDTVSRVLEPNEDPHTGCPALLERIIQIKPKLAACGHIHEAYGISTLKRRTTIVNAAICTFPGYQPNNKPIVIEL
ncbi:MAG: metallophosphatase domain-containing protein [Candidatus Thorarchaeota archaeon]|jgi:Icc-related predicted phosphoesterase